MDRRRIREQACLWLAKLDSGAKDIDYDALKRWLNESPAHLEVLLEMADLWDQTSVLSELSEVFPLASPAKRPGTVLWSKGATALAASVILACVLGLSWLMRVNEQQSADQIALEAPAFYETQVGQQSDVTLPDGSHVLLNTNSLMEITFSDHERRVYLRRGEGLFTVAKDKTRPFRVFAGQRVVEAVGTAFSVQRADEDSVEVIVTEGKINFLVLHQAIEESTEDALGDEVLRDSSVTPLEAGEFVAVQGGAEEPVKTGSIKPEDVEIKLAWQHGMLLFRGDPLEQVLREFGRYTAIRLEATEAVRDIKVAGFYRAGDVDKFLVGIESNFPISVQKINENYFVLTAR
jgi:transmembrane sensor